MENAKPDKPLKKLLQNRWVAVVGLLIGTALLIASNFLPQKSDTDPETYTIQYYTEILEQRITNLCNNIHGVQDATVLLTLECSSEYVYAQNATENGQGSGAWDYVIIQQGSGEETILVTEIYPKIRGVAVVCTGGDTAEIQSTITELLSASLGISSHRIRVAGK